MHIVIAGAGRMGAYHAAIFAALDGVTRVTVVDIDAPRAAQVAAEIAAAAGTRATVAAASDIEVVTTQADADALVIAAATPAHAPLIELGAQAGLPTLCEKPIALDRDATRRALDAVAAAGTYLHIGFQRRFDAGFVAARDAIANGTLGRLHLVRMGTLDPAPPPIGYLRESGGIFRDMHIHDFDALRFVTGDEVETITAVGSVTVDAAIGELGDVDTTAVVATMRSGALVVLSGSRQNPRGYDIRLEAIGSADAITIGLTERTPLRSLDDGGLLDGSAPGWDFFIDRCADAYRLQDADFVARVAGGATAADTSPCSGADGDAAMVLAYAAERSRLSGGAVRISDIEHEPVLGGGAS